MFKRMTTIENILAAVVILCASVISLGALDMFGMFDMPGRTAELSKIEKRGTEVYWAEKFCLSMGGKMEVVVESGARCDCVTDEYAIEVDFSNKWAEALGQSLHYAAELDRTPGICLLLRDSAYMDHMNRLMSTIDRWQLPVTIWPVVVDD